MENNEILSQLADALRLVMEKDNQMHTKAPANFSTTTPLHGQGGIWSVAGIDPNIINAQVHPQGIGAVLKPKPTNFLNPIFGAFTGYTGSNGAEASYPCTDGPTVYSKSCMLTAQFGRQHYTTQTIEFDKLMDLKNRGDFTDLNMIGGPLGAGLAPNGLDEAGILNLVVANEMMGVGVQHERKLSTLLWQGTPANNNAGGGYAEFPGLDVQIATGQRDAISNALCPALDSDVKDFNYGLVCGTTADLIEYLSIMAFYLRDLADRSRVSPVRWVIAMRAGLWFELSECYPCSYMSHRCFVSGGSTNIEVMSNDANVRMRDQMRASMTIPINGITYEVITDDGIFEHAGENANLIPGEYASSIYFIPISIRGGQLDVTYREYKDYRGSFAMQNVELLNKREDFWTDDGIYSWVYEGIKWCFTLSAKTEQRIILRTPWLAGKIQRVKYSPLQHVREAIDTTSPYWLDGGVSLRGRDSLYNVWGQASR